MRDDADWFAWKMLCAFTMCLLLALAWNQSETCSRHGERWAWWTGTWIGPATCVATDGTVRMR